MTFRPSQQYFFLSSSPIDHISAYSVPGKTLSLGGAATVLDGQTLSVASSGLIVVQGEDTNTLQTIDDEHVSGVFVMTAGSKVITAHAVVVTINLDFSEVSRSQVSSAAYLYSSGMAYKTAADLELIYESTTISIDGLGTITAERDSSAVLSSIGNAGSKVSGSALTAGSDLTSAPTNVDATSTGESEAGTILTSQGILACSAATPFLYLTTAFVLLCS